MNDKWFWDRHAKSGAKITACLNVLRLRANSEFGYWPLWYLWTVKP